MVSDGRGRPLDVFLYHVSRAAGLSFTTYGETLDALRSAARTRIARDGAFVISTEAGIILGTR